MSTINSDTISITRYIDAPRDLVFKAWTQAEHVKEWWGPKGFTTPFCKIDLREDGAFHSCMRSPEGQDFWGIGYFKEINEPKKIVLTDSFSDEQGNKVSASKYGMNPNWPLETLITVTFEEENGGTRITMQHKGIPSGEDSENCRIGWSETLDCLEDYIKKINKSK